MFPDVGLRAVVPGVERGAVLAQKESSWFGKGELFAEGQPMRLDNWILTGHDDAFRARVWSFVGGRIPRGTPPLLNLSMEEKREEFVGCGHQERSPCRRCYRNGYHHRWLSTTWGDIRARVPRLRSAQEPFRPRVIGAWQRPQTEVEGAVLV